MKANEVKKALFDGEFDEILSVLYGADNVEGAQKRYAAAIDSFVAIYDKSCEREIELFSVPGRSEISGNHTDHNHGRVLAASIDLDIIAVAAKNDCPMINVKSEGFPEDKVDISTLDPASAKRFGSSAIISGMCDGFAKRGHTYGGFDAYTTSNVLKGSGLSSSAAFEVMIGNILNHFYNDDAVSAPDIAKIAQYAENVFFGKPCGLMDQTACAVGGFVAIDFNDPSAPVIEKLDFSLSDRGYCLCIVNTGGNHADLNEDYASVPAEMKSVAQLFGREVLRGLTFDDILAKAAEIREKLGDRALLRAFHFVEENERVSGQTDALRAGDIDGFLDGVTASGNSSYKKLQNVFTVKNVGEQGLSLALAIAEHVLAGCKRHAACRVHGGGFAGTIQAFVPVEDVPAFKSALEKVFGDGNCYVLSVRPLGLLSLKRSLSLERK